MTDPEIFIKTNVLGTQVLMDASRAYGVERYHQVSTDEVYGDLPLDRPDLFFTEETPLHTSSPYSASKASADLLVFAYHRTFGLPITISRCSNNYGPYPFPEKLIPLIMSRALNDEQLPVYGHGENVRDWLHVYDHCAAPDLFFTEETPLHTSSPYSASKASADLLVFAYHRTFGLPITISRCSNNYGPYHFPEKLIPLMISRALNDEQLPVYGNGENVRDWLHVYDHCAAIDLILHKGKVGEVYNVGGHNERTNLEVVKTILKALNKPESLITYVKDRPGHDLRYAIDPQKLENELGWKPTYNFDTGIQQTIEWYLNNKQWWENIISGEYQNYFEKQYGDR